MSTPKKIKFAIFFFAIFISFLLYFSFFLFSQIQQKSTQILEKKREILTIENRREAIEEFKNKEGEIKRVEEAVFKKELPLPFVEFLEKISKDLGVSFEVSLQEFPTKKKVKTIPIFQIDFSGEFPMVFYFLEKLEKGKFLVSVQKLMISQTEEGLKGSILVEVFAK